MHTCMGVCIYKVRLIFLKCCHENGSIENAGYPNEPPSWGAYLGTPKKTSIKIINNVVKVIHN